MITLTELTNALTAPTGDAVRWALDAAQELARRAVEGRR